MNAWRETSLEARNVAWSHATCFCFFLPTTRVLLVRTKVTFHLRSTRRRKLRTRGRRRICTSSRDSLRTIRNAFVCALLLFDEGARFRPHDPCVSMDVRHASATRVRLHTKTSKGFVLFYPKKKEQRHHFLSTSSHRTEDVEQVLLRAVS